MSRRPDPGRSFAVAAAAVLLVASTSAAQVVVDTCGQELNDDGILMADLDCSAAADPIIHFVKSGTLQLNGFTLSGSVEGEVHRIEIVGPGTITGPGPGVAAYGTFLHGGQATVVGANISGNESFGVRATGLGGRAHARVHDSIVSNNGATGVSVNTEILCPALTCYSQAKLTVERSTISGNSGDGVRASHIRIKDSSVTFNGDRGVTVDDGVTRKVRVSGSNIDDNTDEGIFMLSWQSAKLIVSDSSISRNAVGLLDGGQYRVGIKLKRCTIDDNGIGIWVSGGSNNPEERKRLNLKDTTVLRSATSGVLATTDTTSINLSRSTVSDSATAPGCGATEACADLETVTVPAVRAGSICGTSLVEGSGIPGTSWGVCALD